jgi:hypothetical protein
MEVTCYRRLAWPRITEQLSAFSPNPGTLHLSFTYFRSILPQVAFFACTAKAACLLPDAQMLRVAAHRTWASGQPSSPHFQLADRCTFCPETFGNPPGSLSL